MRRACFLCLNTLKATQGLSRVVSPQSGAIRRHIDGSISFNTSSFSFSSSVKNQMKEEESKFSLKNGSSRLTSQEFLEKIKEVISHESDVDLIIPRSAFDALAAEYDSLLEEVSSLKDKYTRSLAETENVRKRGQRQVEDAKTFAIQGFCKDLLEVADILDLACEAVKKEDIESNEQLNNLYKGVDMMKTVLEKTFSRHGLRKISPEGEKFDPNLHEAVYQVPKKSTNYDAGCVAHVMKIGYALYDRPIRAAKVGVVND